MMWTQAKAWAWIGGTCLWIVTAASAVEKPSSPPTTCVTAECHGQYAEQAHVHGPVGLGDCSGCHQAEDPNAHTYRLTREGRDLCEYCHLDQGTKSHVHQPMNEGQGCLACHDPHASPTKGLLRAPSVSDLCAGCHGVTEGKRHLHGPTAVGQCTVCHDPHTSDFNDLLTVAPQELCVSCHVITAEELTKFPVVHKPVQGDCAGCHDPHGADDPRLLRNTAPALCDRCHEEIRQIAETSEHKHDVVRAPGGCLQCHTPHASTVRFLLKGDPATLCMTCHDKPQGLDPNHVLPAFTDLEGRQFPHGPVQEKNCSGCHQPHGSDHFRLLSQAYPAAFYAPYADENYALCFGCHEKTLVQTPRTEALTDFRNGDRNLHYVHVNKVRRGRTCRACHETHASNQPKHIRESVPYGIWNLPINFKKTDTGGRCAPGCHVPFDYDRSSPVDYEASRGTEPVAANTRSQP